MLLFSLYRLIRSLHGALWGVSWTVGSSWGTIRKASWLLKLFSRGGKAGRHQQGAWMKGSRWKESVLGGADGESGFTCSGLTWCTWCGEVVWCGVSCGSCITSRDASIHPELWAPGVPVALVGTFPACAHTAVFFSVWCLCFAAESS